MTVGPLFWQKNASSQELPWQEANLNDGLHNGLGLLEAPYSASDYTFLPRK